MLTMTGLKPPLMHRNLGRPVFCPCVRWANSDGLGTLKRHSRVRMMGLVGDVDARVLSSDRLQREGLGLGHLTRRGTQPYNTAHSTYLSSDLLGEFERCHTKSPGIAVQHCDQGKHAGVVLSTGA